jgi:Family of unknown function (DUF6334)
MSIYRHFNENFFAPFAELCSSSQQLLSVEGQFFLQDGPLSLVAIKLNFEKTSVLAVAQDDDSISLKWNDRFVNMGDHQIRLLNGVSPWHTAVSRPLLWAWIMFNQQGYFDGLRFEFAETAEAPVSRIQLLVVGSEFKYQ